MAFASSRIGAQEVFIKPCDLCEDDENVNWFCKDCVQNICERCKKTHLKTATCINHRIVSILEGVAIAKKNVPNLCHKHNEPFTFFCRTCEDNICSICLSMDHKKHEFRDLHDVHSELQSKLDKIMMQKLDEQMQMTKEIGELEKYANQCRDSLTKTCETIDDRIRAINASVNEEGHKLKETFKTTTDKQLAEAEEKRRNLERRKHKYDEAIETIQQELNLQTTASFTHFAKASTSKLKSLERMTNSIPSSTRFTAGGTSKDLVVKMIGKIEVQRNVRQSHERVNRDRRGIDIFSKLHIVYKHTLFQNFCYCICTSPDGGIWVGSLEFVYKISSDCATVIHQIPSRKSFLGLIPCVNIACLQSGDAVASGVSSSYVDKFTSDGRRVEFSKAAKGSIFDIAVTNHDEVAVLVHKGLMSPTSSLVVHSKTGKQVNAITLDTKLRGFCINNEDNYVISEKRSQCLTTFDMNGTILPRKKIAIPALYRMTCDSYGNILGLPRESKNKEVYLTSDDGEVQRFFSVKCDICINDICIDQDNRLLVLVDAKTVIIAKYLESE